MNRSSDDDSSEDDVYAGLTAQLQLGNRADGPAAHPAIAGCAPLPDFVAHARRCFGHMALDFERGMGPGSVFSPVYQRNLLQEWLRFDPRGCGFVPRDAVLVMAQRLATVHGIESWAMDADDAAGPPAPLRD